MRAPRRKEASTSKNKAFQAADGASERKLKLLLARPCGASSLSFFYYILTYTDWPAVPEEMFFTLWEPQKSVGQCGATPGSAHYALVLVPWKKSNTVLRQLRNVFLDLNLNIFCTYFDTFWRPCGQLFPNILPTFWRIFCHFFANILRKIWRHLDQTD